MSDNPIIQRIKNQPNVAVNEIREQSMCCIACGTKLGFVSTQTIAPAEGGFAFRIRFSCADCGQKTATLSLIENKGLVN